MVVYPIPLQGSTATEIPEVLQLVSNVSGVKYGRLSDSVARQHSNRNSRGPTTCE